jgi:hypothetical protein
MRVRRERFSMGRRSWFSVAAAALVLAVFTAAGVAQDVPDAPDPWSTTGQPNPQPDTAYTPVAKDACEIGWQQVAGSVFPDSKPCGDYRASRSPERDTIHTVDFFTVSFFEPDRGLAGGAACENRGVTRDELDALKAAGGDCPRVPVIWEYSRPPANPADPPGWREVFRGTEAGYVAAIAWRDQSGERAMAVGGSGVYPRREQPVTLDDSGYKPDPSGDARVWLLDDGAWDAYTRIPAEVRGRGGLSALDFSQRPSDCSAAEECAFAGGLGAIWMWADGQFKPDPPNSYRYTAPTSCPLVLGSLGTDPGPGPTDCDAPFRVRSVRFRAGGALAQNEDRAQAVTSGCCYGQDVAGQGLRDQRTNHGRLLAFSLTRSWQVTASDRTLVSGDQRTRAPESFYALAWGGTQGNLISAVSAPGGPPPADGSEPASVVVGPGAKGRGWLSDATLGLAPYVARPDLSSMRLVAGDGDIAGKRPRFDQQHQRVTGVPPDTSRPDGVMDWAVGELRASGQALAFRTTGRPYSAIDAPDPLKCPSAAGFTDVSAECRPEDQPGKITEQTTSGDVFSLPSYALNGFTALGTSGSFWTVGDRGAIFSFGTTEQAASLETVKNPPTLGAPEQVALSNRAPYDPFRPLGAVEPGVVPPLAAQPVEKLETMELVPAGSPRATVVDSLNEGVNEIVMSRDGSEGWALGPVGYESTYSKTTLYHYSGGRWTRCDSRGVPGVLAPDPECAALRELMELRGSGVHIAAAARVPLELDDNPANDDEFELVALTKPPEGANETEFPKAVLRYRAGRWSVDAGWTAELASVGFSAKRDTQIVFAAPDDAWVVATDVAGSQSFARFAGDDGWVSCSAGRRSTADPRCDDPDHALLPFGEAASEDSATGVGSGSHLASVEGRVYLYGTRVLSSSTRQQANTGSGAAYYPYILYRDRGESGWHQAYDPSPKRGGEGQVQGCLHDLSVVRAGDGYNGWAIGALSRGETGNPCATKALDAPTETALLRLSGDGTDASPYPADRVTADYLLGETVDERPVDHYSPDLVALPDGSTVLHPSTTGNRAQRPLLRFDPSRSRWEVLPAPFTGVWGDSNDLLFQGNVAAVAADGQGGAWLSARTFGVGGVFPEWLYHYTDERSEPVFDDVAHPVREPIAAAAAGGDGSLWVTTHSDFVYRYERMTGWERIRLKGWDPGRVVTNPSPAYAVAVGPDGEGIVVGLDGRIADVSARGAVLDRAAGRATPQTLRAAAVAPDGSALAGGDSRAILWRPAGGEFRAVTKPLTASRARITGLSMPEPDRAWLTTGTGEVFAGERHGSDWSWAPEARDGTNFTLARTPQRDAIPLRAVAVDAQGHGFAVGDHGVVLERRSTGGWRRLRTGQLEDMVSVTLGPGGRGALIGGQGGLILTLAGGQFEVARGSDYFDPLITGYNLQSLARTVAVGLSAGERDGEVEAWAAVQGMSVGGGERPPTSALLHYSSSGSSPLLDGGAARARPLPDAPSARPGELSFAAFGNSDCNNGHPADACPEPLDSNVTHDVLARRVREELIDRAARADGPALGVFTGDMSDVAGHRDRQVFRGPTDPSIIHRRWAELTADPLREAGLPLYAAIGARDLSYTQTSPDPPHNYNFTTKETRAGANIAWRQAMLGMAPPWGAGPQAEAGGVEIVAVPGSPQAPQDTPVLRGGEVGSTYVPKVGTVPGTRQDPDGPNGFVPEVAVPETTVGDVNTFPSPPYSAPTGGANTHYAFDVKRGGRAVARFVFVDTSLTSVAASDALQTPTEEQLTWLRAMLCVEGQAPVATKPCTRAEGERAVVVSNTPTYSYGPGATSDTLTESTAFEQVLFDGKVDMVVSGRLGWNARYWAHAPGVHEPCQGGGYQDAPSSGGAALCGAPTGEAPDPSAAADELAVAAGGLGAPAAPEPNGALPFVIASSVAGPFGPHGEDEDSSPSDGFWHGYTIVRIASDGSFAPIVEQRPVLDWVGIRAAEHTLRPGQRMTLRGYGREPVGIDKPIRYLDSIDSSAITHRYDLVMADPEQPWLPLEDANGDYVAVPAQVATVDRQTGAVRAGKGRGTRTYTIAILSVGDKAATSPIAFEPRRSSSPPRARTILPPLPRPARAPAAQAPIRLSEPPTPPPAQPPASPASPFSAQTLQPPQPPQIPSLPAANAPPAPAPPQLQVPPPPVPPAPPSVPPQQQPIPLALNAKLQAISLVPSVNPPAPPPVNPAPPAGGAARKEAKQRQAAAAKSEEGSKSEAQQAGGDLAEGPAGDLNAMTRRERTRPAPSFSARAREERLPFSALAEPRGPSASARAALYGGGIGLAAIAIALGFSVLRPRPRRTPPEVAAPAWARTRRL